MRTGRGSQHVVIPDELVGTESRVEHDPVPAPEWIESIALNRIAAVLL